MAFATTVLINVIFVNTRKKQKNKKKTIIKSTQLSFQRANVCQSNVSAMHTITDEILNIALWASLRVTKYNSVNARK